MPPVRQRVTVERKSRFTYIQKRITRRWSKREVDFISLLPTEIGLMILKKLPAQDLGRCLQVSKAWNSLANSDQLWKRHCDLCGIDPLEAKQLMKEINPNSNLCKWAQIYRLFRNSPAFGWMSKNWKTLEVDREGVYTKNASDGEVMVFCSGSELTFRKVSQYFDSEYSVKTPLPPYHSSTLAVDNKYVAVAKCNIVLVYKLINNVYKCVLGLALNGEELNKTKKFFPRFVKQHLKETTQCVCIIALLKGCIWVRENGQIKSFVINIANQKVRKVQIHFYRFVTRTYIVSWARRHLRVDNFSGRCVLKLCRDINKARANNHILVTFCFTGQGPDYEQVMETWELSSGKRLLSMTRPKQAFFEIHPSRNILYQIEALNDTITSLCPLSGKVFWTVQVPCMEDILDWCLRVVCGRFLVLFQLKANHSADNSLYVFDALNGNYLYKVERPAGHLEHLSDNLMMAKTSSKICMRIFSGNR